MEYYLLRIREEIATKVGELLGVAAIEVAVINPAEGIDADIAVPCFALAKQTGLPPEELAKKIAGELSIEQSSSVIAEGGYVNIRIDSVDLAKALNEDLTLFESYGETHQGEGKKVVIDFIGLNLSKPFSVGHLRPTVQGWSLIQIYQALGYGVVSDSHMGDWGTPFGMWVVGFEKWGSEEKLSRDGAYELGRLYSIFREKVEKDPALLDEAKSWLKKLESGDESAMAYHKRFNAISLNHAEKVLKRLKIAADENLGESFYIEQAQKLVDELIRKGPAEQQEDGCVIVRLDEFGIETPALLRKADGSALYLTSELETIRYRVERWAPVKIIYSVGGEQQFHFEQAFSLAKKLGYLDNTELIHSWFGTIDEIGPRGKRRKMSSRTKTALLENLLDMAEEKAREIIGEGSLSSEDIQIISVGAIKFNDFSQPKKTNILFDWESMFTLQGYSSVYIQYAAVRIGSILSELEKIEEKPNFDYDWENERSLIRQMLAYPEILQKAAQQCEPYYIADYLFALAKHWNRYYEQTSVRGSEKDILSSRVWLLRNLQKNFIHALQMLGIEVPSRM